jgi:transcriptional regulator with XRE-family HTH domain
MSILKSNFILLSVEKNKIILYYIGKRRDLIMTDAEQKQIFAKNLLTLLEKNGKTQREVADSISVSPQTFNTWCQGIALPRMGKIQKLADYFNVDKTFLIDQKPITETPDEPYYLNDETRQIAQEAFENPELRTLFHVARDIPPERLKAHIEFMKSLKAQEKGDPDEPC